MNVYYTNMIFGYTYKIKRKESELKSKVTNMKFTLDVWLSTKINSDNEFITMRKTGRDLLVNYEDINSKPAFAIAYSVNRNCKCQRNKVLEKKFEEIAKRRGGF